MFECTMEHGLREIEFAHKSGVYMITNNVTGERYIGQSRNLRKRYCEHRVPSEIGNDRLHKDMREYGLSNFSFHVLKYCTDDELISEEKTFIRNCQPEYNFVNTEKMSSPTVRKNISNGAKKWWNQLDNSVKERIINENLTGPTKGHPVSKETRQKIGNAAAKYGVPVMIVETGETFDKIVDLERHLGASDGTVAAYFNGKLKSVKGYNVVKLGEKRRILNGNS